MVFYNYMVWNPSKCHFMKLGFQDQNFDLHYENIVIENSSEEKLFGITREDKLNFECYIINICTVSNQKLSPICKVT